jgi:NAD-dependent dihydropyrimidine dehydrogenase PreA subunit/protein-S-isoprenylcysteine O-methyltransferase Ste14
LPIDPDFQKNREKVGKEEGIAIWGPVEPPEKLGIRGTNVAVDWDLCTGCGKCIEVCPVKLYEWKDTPGHPTSEKKAFPSRESDCNQCFQCDKRCPVQAIRVIFWPSGWIMAMAYLTMAQMMFGVAYGTFMGPYLGLRIPLYIGWAIVPIGLFFMVAPGIYFPKKGRPQEGKTTMDTTVLVDSGTYGIVRHPQFLGGIMLMSASILISQHWLSAVVGILTVVWGYTGYLPKEEKGLIIRFGDDYRRYMERVPRLNLIVGLIRLLREGRS